MKFDLDETDDILIVDLEPYSVNGSFSGEMSTIRVILNDRLIDWWPKIGPWSRSEQHGAEIAGIKL